MHTNLIYFVLGYLRISKDIVVNVSILQEVDLMLNDGSKHINVVEWKKQINLTRRVDISRRRSRRCSVMSLDLSKTPEEQVIKVHSFMIVVYF